MAHVVAHGRRWGARGEPVRGNPLEPTEALPHEAWFLAGPTGEVGALLVDGTLHLAVGRDGAGWRRTKEGLEHLAL
jgi:hypothetical protein